MSEEGPISLPGSAAHRNLIRAAVLLLLAGLALELAIATTPYPGLERGTPAESLRIYDRHGQLLGERVGADGHRRRSLPLSRVSPWLIQATIAIEDRRFYAHDGVDARAVLRAAIQNARAGRIVSGASTITMQTVRLLEPHPRGFGPKVREAIDARRLEYSLSKQDILELYLNRAPYGAGTVGIEAASRRYFGKPARRLTLAEAALLAGLPQGPGRLDPLRFPERARARRATVLARMRAAGFIDRGQQRRAHHGPLGVISAPPQPVARHYTDAIVSRHARRFVRGGVARGTLDLALQRDLEGLVREHVRTLSHRGLTNAAAVVLDNADCAVRAMVGSVDYDHPEGGAVNGALARRQPGSTLKPFAYALAFEQGYGPASIVADVPMWFDGPGGRYRPRNYDGRFRGPVMMGEALARSLNITAIRVAQTVDPARLLDRLRAVGLTGLDRDAGHYGLGLVLGNGEVSLVELAQSYAALARGGLSCRARLLTDAPPAPATAVFPTHVTAQITDVLADDRLRILAFGADNALMLGFPMAIKSGTSENWRDSWVVGYTARHTVAVWAGDFTGRSMQALSGVSGAGPLFHRVAHRVVGPDGDGLDPLGGLGKRAEQGPTVHDVQVCLLSGRAPTPLCPAGRRVRTTLVPGTPAARAVEPDRWMRAVAIDARNGLRAGPSCPAEHVRQRVFAHLPSIYAEWQADHPELPPPPSRYSPACPAERPAPPVAVRVTHPIEGDVFLLDPGATAAHQRIALAARVDPPSAAVEWWVDGRRVDRADWPYQGAWTLARGRHRVEAVVQGTRSAPVVFDVR